LEPFVGIPQREMNGRFVIGMIARMFPYKGHEDLMKFASQLLGKWTDVDFLIIGDGPLHSGWDEWIKTHPQWKSRFVFTGRVAPEEIPACLQKMDVLIHLSLREGLPRTVAQALAAAKPVCVYDIGGTSEIVENEVTGFLVSPGDLRGMVNRIDQIRKSPKASRLMGEKGREKVRSLFSPEKMGNEIIQLYKELGVQ